MYARIEKRSVMSATYILHLLIMSLSVGTRSHQLNVVDSKKSSSFTAESGVIVEFGEVTKEEDLGSIKEGGDVEMKFNKVDEKANNQGSNCNDNEDSFSHCRST